jgi:hypothetical protein
VDGDAGILDVIVHPYLKFTILIRDGLAGSGREIVFTTDPGLLRKLKLIRRGDKVVDVSKRSRAAHADAGLLWRAALAERNHEPVTPPMVAHWYLVARAAPRHSSRRSLPGTLDAASPRRAAREERRSP